MSTLSLPLPQGFSTFHDIDVFRCSVAEISDNLAGDKRLIVLIISVLQQIIAARSYKKTYHLAGIGIVYICRNILSVNTLRHIGVQTSPARVSYI